jgi:hypothetical protein
MENDCPSSCISFAREKIPFLQVHSRKSCKRNEPPNPRYKQTVKQLNKNTRQKPCKKKLHLGRKAATEAEEKT